MIFVYMVLNYVKYVENLMRMSVMVFVVVLMWGDVVLVWWFVFFLVVLVGVYGLIDLFVDVCGIFIDGEYWWCGWWWKMWWCGVCVCGCVCVCVCVGLCVGGVCVWCVMDGDWFCDVVVCGVCGCGGGWWWGWWGWRGRDGGCVRVCDGRGWCEWCELLGFYCFDVTISSFFSADVLGTTWNVGNFKMVLFFNVFVMVLCKLIGI